MAQEFPPLPWRNICTTTPLQGRAPACVGTWDCPSQIPTRNGALTFLDNTHRNIKMNIPWNALKIVKRYAVTTDPWMTWRTPKIQVAPRRKRRARAPRAQDLEGRKHCEQHADRYDLPSFPVLAGERCPGNFCTAARAWETQMHGLLFRVCCSTVSWISSHNHCGRAKE